MTQLRSADLLALSAVPNGAEALPEPMVAARFSVLAEASPGLLSRILEPFAKRDLTPDQVRAARDGQDGALMRTEVSLSAMPLCMVGLVAGNLGQIFGVLRVEAMEGRVVRLAA
jgi:acetolactate synthase small subunit